MNYLTLNCLVTYILEVYLKPSLGETSFNSAASNKGTKLFAIIFMMTNAKTIVEIDLGV